AAEPDEARRTIAAAGSFDRVPPAADALLAGVHRPWVERDTAPIAVRAAGSGAAAALRGGAAQVSTRRRAPQHLPACGQRRGAGRAGRASGHDTGGRALPAVRVGALWERADARVLRRGAGVQAPVTRRQRLTLIAAIVGSGVAMIDGSIVNVALPSIERDLGG